MGRADDAVEDVGILRGNGRQGADRGFEPLPGTKEPKCRKDGPLRDPECRAQRRRRG